MIEAAGTFLANIDNAPLKLNSLSTHHVYESSDTLVARLIDHYTFQALTVQRWHPRAHVVLEAGGGD